MAGHSLGPSTRGSELRIDLTGLTALVTGSTRGIGFTTAQKLAECGATVVINGRTDAAVAAAVAALSETHPDGEFRAIAADISTPDGARILVTEQPAVDVLVCNAAVFDWTPFFESTDELWLHHFEINVMSGVRLARHYLAGMLERDWGRVVLVASESGFNIPGDMIHYGVSKAAEVALARGLAELTRGTGVTVNSVLPGPTGSSNVDAALDKYAEDNQVPREDADRHMVGSIRPTSLIQRLATMDEVANMIVYTSSRLSSATNGAALRAEGGILRHPG